MRLSDLLENNAQEMADAANLKARLLQPGIVEVSNAGYDTDIISLGHLELIGAGRILRKNSSYKGRFFGFQYGTELDGQPIRATLHVAHHVATLGSTIGPKKEIGHILKPGERFIEEV